MIRIIILIFFGFILFGSVGTKTTNSSNTSSYSSGYSSNKSSYTDSELESLACSALYHELNSAKNKQGVPLKNLYNISSTKYSIGSIKKTGSDRWTVKGTFFLFNDYGELRKSGTFTAYISSGGNTTCSISLK